MSTDANANERYWWRQPSPTQSPIPTANSVQYGRQAASKEGMEETAVSHPPICSLTPPKPGNICPACNQGKLAYDGLFILTCDRCGYVAESGCFS